MRGVYLVGGSRFGFSENEKRRKKKEREKEEEKKEGKVRRKDKTLVTNLFGGSNVECDIFLKKFMPKQMSF